MTSALNGLVDRLGPLPFCFALLLVTVLVAEVIGTPDVVRAEQQLLIYVVLTVGLFTFIGLTGVLSFGHSTFVAAGAYMTAFLTMPITLKKVLIPALPEVLANAHISLAVAMVLGGLVGALVAVLLGSPLMRLSGLQAGIATLSLLFIGVNVISNWSDLTKGPGSLSGVPLDAGIGFELAIAVLACLLAWIFARSRTGRLLASSREDEHAAKAVGVNVVRLRIVALAISAGIMGAGGGELSHYLGVLSPAVFGLSMTFLTISMLIIGGRTTLTGAVVGAVAVSVVTELSQHLEEGISVAGLETPSVAGLETLLIAAAMLLILILRPRGLTDGREFARAPTFRAPAAPIAPLWPAPANGVEGPGETRAE